ncbi:MAG: hypothetical protein OXP66_13095 [Candidatus Tectomicrobia bacterium]|nr:hypothetical protein [Candidatus Tectomicrobia bacterium]
MRQCYHERQRNTNPKQKTPTIPGGSYSIPPTALIILWAAYRQRKLNWLALRVWLALWEIKCWHEARHNSVYSPRYDTSQIASAIKTPNVTAKRLATAVSALQRLNLAAFTSTTLWIATDLDDLQDLELREVAVEMLSHIGHTNLARGMRMPRRMLVFLMTSQRPRPVYAGVMFALLIRTMLTKRYESYKGCCTASWIALVFGGDPSSIKSARSRLIEDGWFTRLGTPQRVRQRYGEWVLLGIERPVDKPAVAEPPTPPNPVETEPPLRNQSLSCEIETNQSLQPGASQTSWTDIHPLDLRSQQRREQLYQSAIGAKVISPCAADHQTFFAAIAHARRVAKRNACGLLRRIIETPLYRQFITQTDEDQAFEWLQAPSPEPVLPPQLRTKPARDELIVAYIKRRLQGAGFSTHNAFILSMTTHEGQALLAGWTQERWDRACVTQREKDWGLTKYCIQTLR